MTDLSELLRGEPPPEPVTQRAVICSDGDEHELFLFLSGEDARTEVDEVGSHSPMDHDIAETPGPGIWVWEGILKYRSWRDLEGCYDQEINWVGSFRAPTEDEWRCIRLGRTPWPDPPEEADLDECIDCGASTAPGTPCPHVCEVRP